MTTITLDTQTDELTRWAQGSLPHMAAAHMLIHSPLKPKLWPVLTHRNHYEETTILTLDSAAGQLDQYMLSGGELAVARLIIELGDVDTGTPLAEMLCRLDPANAAAFYQAATILTEGA